MLRTLTETARLLAHARAQGKRITLDPAQRPASLADAYALQDAIGNTLNAPIRGWKVGAPNADATPTAAPIYDVLPAPARIAASRMNMIGVEAEIAFVFGSGLPARANPYRDDEVLGAVRELCIAIEVCDSRLLDWKLADDFTKLADHQLNFALVTGDATANFRAIDFRRQAVRTLVDGKTLKEGVGCHALGDPIPLLPWLANHAASRGGLKCGDVVTTGSWLGMHFVEPGANVVVEFPGLGSAAVSFPA